MLFGPFLAFKAQSMSKTGCLAIILAHSETYLILPTFTCLFHSFLILRPLVAFSQPSQIGGHVLEFQILSLLDVFCESYTNQN